MPSGGHWPLSWAEADIDLAKEEFSKEAESLLLPDTDTSII